MVCLRSKRGYEFSFAWIFALIVGAVVIFIAIYLATQIVGMNQSEIDATRAKEIGVLLTPVETELESARVATIIVPDKTILFNECIEESAGVPFGSQLIGTSVEQALGQGDSESGVQSTFYNKYLFTSSPQITSEKYFYTMAKPLEIPFKIADLLIVWSDQERFCFVNPPSEINRELNDLNASNIYVESSLSGCPTGQNDKTVCFGGGNCDIRVSVDTINHVGYVEKTNPTKTLYYFESMGGTDRYGLLYAAIFSDPDIYECQISRLMAHASQLAELYGLKINSITGVACLQTMPSALSDYVSATNTVKNRAGGLASDSEAQDIFNKAERIDRANPTQCLLY